MLFLVSIVASLAAQQVPTPLTDHEQAALKKIEKRYDNIMSTEAMGIFTTLRKCLDIAGEKIERCLAAALLNAETKKHKNFFTFIHYYLSRISFTCLKIEIAIGNNKALLADEEKRKSFPPKVLELLGFWKICDSTKDDTRLAAKVQNIMLKEYKRRPVSSSG